MNLNEAVIPHYRAKIIPIEELKTRVSLNERYLREKSTWYDIDNKLQYFKIRNDFRLFTEQFFSMFAREILDLDTVDYKVSFVRTIKPGVREEKEKTKCGLLSENFQTNEYNYYLVSELLNAEISNFIAYGGYNLQSLLRFFKDYLTYDDYKVNELFLIKLFIADGFTHEEDRNYNNICFKIPKIDGIPYTKRLQSEILKNEVKAQNEIEIVNNNQALLKHFSPTKVFDSERILGTDHKNTFTYKKKSVWKPLFPFSEDLRFISNEKATIKSKEYDGLDPNLAELYFSYESICKPIFERLAYDNEYARILERFKDGNSQIILNDKSLQRVTKIFEEKQEVLRRILKY